MGRMNALEQFNAGLAPPNWRREHSADGIVFVHTERGVRLQAEAVDAEAREPGLDVAPWTLTLRWSLGEATVSRTIGRTAGRESTVEALYRWMVRINVRLRESGDTAAGLTSIASPAGTSGSRLADAEVR